MDRPSCSQRNLKDSGLREVARQKARASKEKVPEAGAQSTPPPKPLTTATATATATTPPPPPPPQYRDRASERRILFNQPDVPVLDAGAPSKSNSSNGRRAEGPPPPPSPPPQPVAPAKDESNVGNKLLKMMGWTEGTGLGLEGEGRVDPMLVHPPFAPFIPSNSKRFLIFRAARRTCTLLARAWVQARAGKLGSIRTAILDTSR